MMSKNREQEHGKVFRRTEAFELSAHI